MCSNTIKLSRVLLEKIRHSLKQHSHTSEKKAFHRGRWRKLVSLCVCVRMTTAEHQVTKRWNACAVGGRKREGGVRENQRDGER